MISEEVNEFSLSELIVGEGGNVLEAMSVNQTLSWRLDVQQVVKQVEGRGTQGKFEPGAVIMKLI